MIWILGLVAIVIVIAIFAAKRVVPADRVHFDGPKDRVSSLSQAEQDELARETREMALSGYERGAERAQASGKGDAFVHQVGVLEAAQTVLANNNRQDDAVTRALQMETVPFNKLEPVLGRDAVVEYLVWKYFPDRAKMEPLTAAMREFVDQVYKDSDPGSDDTQFAYEMIYSGKYDWQQLAVLQAKARVGEANA